ncbi:redoxin domain-containing protein [Mucilaginibacter sp. CAU 1740]|uniref:redoxin domain-containing protein n=1 Tax=Mucilaginibacter sp. CAU 1740 TaxID=3140365 RepID=UPI00325AA962
MKKILVIILSAFCLSASAQSSLKTGDAMPAIVIKPIINAPVSQVNLNAAMKPRFYILNFWGTWCSPCIPEMDNLAKLQKANEGRVQIIGVSNDPVDRLKKYLAKKPSTLWLASDTSFYLYKAFGFTSVGQAAIINSRHQVVALVNTDSVNQHMVNKLLSGKPVKSSADLKELPVNTSKDVFGVDSTMAENFTIRGYMIGQQAMARHYLNPPYSGRRVSYINTCAEYLYKDAFDITSSKQVIYEVDEKTVCDFDNKASRYCLDLLVKPEDKDSLYSILQKKLLTSLPIKARLSEKMIPVYVLKTNPAQKQAFSTSTQNKTSYSFNGNGYDGIAVTVEDFAKNYLSNEFDLPVVDETGLSGKYDIKTTVDLRTKEGIMQSVNKLGLVLSKAERKMKVLVFYK